jgi:hypothetical protein
MELSCVTGFPTASMNNTSTSTPLREEDIVSFTVIYYYYFNNE